MAILPTELTQEFFRYDLRSQVVNYFNCSDVRNLIELFPLAQCYWRPGIHYETMVTCTFDVNDRLVRADEFYSPTDKSLYKVDGMSLTSVELLNYLFFLLPAEKQHELKKTYYDENHFNPILRTQLEDSLYQCSELYMEFILAEKLHPTHFQLSFQGIWHCLISFRVAETTSPERFKLRISTLSNPFSFKHPDETEFSCYQKLFAQFELELAVSHPDISLKRFSKEHDVFVSEWLKRTVLHYYFQSSYHQMKSRFSCQDNRITDLLAYIKSDPIKNPLKELRR